MPWNNMAQRIEDALLRLQSSNFRARFHLSEKDICQLIAASDGFSYSDIEYAIKEVAQSALIEGQAVITPQLLLKCFENVVPISKNNPDMVEKIRKWGSERAVAASNIAGGKADEQL